MSEITGRLGGPREPEQSDPTSELQPNARGARWLRRHLATRAAALTTVVDGEYRAATITAFTMVSIEPPLILVSLEGDTQMEGWLRRSRLFGLSLLEWKQQVLADRFAGLAPLAPAKFEGIPHTTAATGAPLLTDSLAWADCRIVAQFLTGDHTCFVGQVVGLGAGAASDGDPLVYYRNRYYRLR